MTEVAPPVAVQQEVTAEAPKAPTPATVGASDAPETPEQTAKNGDVVQAEPSESPGPSNGTEGDHDSGVDETTQGTEGAANGDSGAGSPKKSPSRIPGRRAASSPTKAPRSPLKAKMALASALTEPAPVSDKKKVPMNKVQVGSAPSPNLKTVRSKIGSLDNASYKPGGGQVKIESRKLDFSKAQPKIAAKNDAYVPGGGDKKIQQVKLAWNAKPKVGSLDNATHKPGGGDKKIETVKLDFKDRAKPKVGSKDNVKHSPGGGNVKIESHKLDVRADSKVGSLANVTHKPGGGEVRIFDDKDYLRQRSLSSRASSEGRASGTQEDFYSQAMERLRKMYITPYFKKSVSLGHLTPRYKLGKSISGLFNKLSASSNTIGSSLKTAQSKQKLDKVAEDQQQDQKDMNGALSDGVSNRNLGEATVTKSQNCLYTQHRERARGRSQSQVFTEDLAEPPGTDDLTIEITINEGAQQKTDVTVHGTGRLPTIEACTKFKESPAAASYVESEMTNVKKQYQHPDKHSSQKVARANGELPEITQRSRRM